MVSQIVRCIVVVATFSGITQAGDYYNFPAHVFASPPVVYAAPVMAYQPAYVVPSMSVVSVHTYPVTTISYSTQYYAPLVTSIPSVAYASVPVATYYPPQPIFTPSVYAVPIDYGPQFFQSPYRGTEIEYERDGDVEIEYR